MKNKSHLAWILPGMLYIFLLNYQYILRCLISKFNRIFIAILCIFCDPFFASQDEIEWERATTCIEKYFSSFFLCACFVHVEFSFEIYFFFRFLAFHCFIFHHHHSLVKFNSSLYSHTFFLLFAIFFYFIIYFFD